MYKYFARQNIFFTSVHDPIITTVVTKKKEEKNHNYRIAYTGNYAAQNV